MCSVRVSVGCFSSEERCCRRKRRMHNPMRSIEKLSRAAARCLKKADGISSMLSTSASSNQSWWYPSVKTS